VVQDGCITQEKKTKYEQERKIREKPRVFKRIIKNRLHAKNKTYLLVSAKIKETATVQPSKTI
jgi:hypothetical protein